HLRQREQRIAFAGLYAKHFGRLVSNFVKFKLLVIDKSQSIDPNVDRPGNFLDRRGFSVPVYLRVQEVFCETKLFELLERCLRIIFARNRLQNASAIQRLNDLSDVLVQPEILVLQKNTVPERMI